MKYDLVGIDGNAYAIMAYVRRAMQFEKKSREDIEKYLKDATSGDYDNLLQLSLEMIGNLNEGK
jgi:hypothetical protein